MKDNHVDVLVPALIRILLAMKADRPPAWSASFEGLSPIDLHVLAIAEVEPDVILREIKEHLGMPHSTLTGIVDRLEEKGLAERIISPRDRRSFGLKLTPRGRELRDEQRRVRRDAARRMLEALDSDAERETFIALMARISDRFGSEAEQ